MAETIALTAPVSTTRSTIRITRVDIDVESKRIAVEWASNLSTEAFRAIYDSITTPTGATLLTTINKMNFALANPSFVARIIARLQTDGFIAAGTVSGTPD